MNVRDLVWTALLYVAAAPMFLLRTLAGLLPQRSAVLERGAVDCTTCGSAIALSRKRDNATPVKMSAMIDGNISRAIIIYRYL